MQLGQSLVQGSYIVGFLDQGPGSDGATANSGAILVTWIRRRRRFLSRRPGR